MRGRKRLPAHLRLIQGRRPKNPNEPKPPQEIPGCPDYLSKAAKKLWPRAVKVYQGMGILTVVDGPALGQLLEAFVDFWEAQAVIEKFGKSYYTSKTQGGGIMHRAHPAMNDKNLADRRIRAWLSEFGGTPAARARLSVNPNEPQTDVAEKYFS